MNIAKRESREGCVELLAAMMTAKGYSVKFVPATVQAHHLIRWEEMVEWISPVLMNAMTVDWKGQ